MLLADLWRYFRRPCWCHTDVIFGRFTDRCPRHGGYVPPAPDFRTVPYGDR